ncbi:hypothetical protein AAGS61_03095 [Lysinibacillus sp. KU-BSD001]|uniref:hypothetical protein n=1 Tax=Lysinibacillus sp. KU-BSD001 TaxID=3141328 RepID=UPI0036E48B22
MKFKIGQLVQVKAGFGSNAGELRIIVGYEADKQVYISKKATKKGNIDKRSSEWNMKCPESRLEEVEI